MDAELRSLNVSNNDISRVGTLALCKHLTTATPLNSLSIRSARLSDSAGGTIASLLLPCSACQLSFLDLSQNFGLGSDTATKISQALEYNLTLKEFRLSSCHLGVNMDNRCL